MCKYIFIVFFSLAFSLGLLSCGLHGLLPDELSESKIVEALQEALYLGSQTAAENLSEPCKNQGDCTTGYLGNKLVEIALPDTVKNVLDKIDSFTDNFDNLPAPVISAVNSFLNSNSSLLKTSVAAGSTQSISLSNLSNLRNLGSRIKETLNRGAEEAAPQSVDLFKDAIFGMSFSDARSILFGDDSIAATSYLEAATFTGLQGIFGGILKSHLDKLGLNNYWGSLASNYNSFANAYSLAEKNNGVKLALSLSGTTLPKLPYGNLPNDLSGELSNYATGKALGGLFYMVGVQESKLRADPWGAVKAAGKFLTDAIRDLLGDVFSKAKEG